MCVSDKVRLGIGMRNQVTLTGGETMNIRFGITTMTPGDQIKGQTDAQRSVGYALATSWKALYGPFHGFPGHTSVGVEDSFYSNSQALETALKAGRLNLAKPVATPSVTRSSWNPFAGKPKPSTEPVYMIDPKAAQLLTQNLVEGLGHLREFAVWQQSAMQRMAEQLHGVKVDAFKDALVPRKTRLDRYYEG
jgi:hypothetical protein